MTESLMCDQTGDLRSSDDIIHAGNYRICMKLLIQKFQEFIYGTTDLIQEFCSLQTGKATEDHILLFPVGTNGRCHAFCKSIRLHKVLFF